MIRENGDGTLETQRTLDTGRLDTLATDPRARMSRGFRLTSQARTGTLNTAIRRTLFLSDGAGKKYSRAAGTPATLTPRSEVHVLARQSSQ
jgi:hypothetical protein